MKQRFSKQELFAIRNNIPINTLIANILPSKYNEGFFRFICPICSQFQTSTDQKTNLSRCFNCKINFNTIEIVKYTKGLSFVESVYFLKKHFKNLLQKETRQSLDKFKQDAHQLKDSNKKINSIGSILQSITPELTNPKISSIKTHSLKCNQDEIIQRISNLEQQVRYLTTELKKIIASMN